VSKRFAGLVPARYNRAMPMLITRARQTFKNIDPTLLIVLALCLLAAWSFLLRPSLPRETDTELHVFRTAELGSMIREGILYARWAPDFYYGYGYPIFNYYAPCTYYLANLFSLALPGGAVFGVKMVFVFGFLLAGIGMWGIGRTLVSSQAGVFMAVVYLFAPYIYLIDPHTRGVLAETFALGAAPFALWMLARWVRSPDRASFVGASLGMAGVLLSHNIMAVVLLALALAFVLWEIHVTRASDNPSGRWTVTLRGVLPIGIALLLSMFFWIPVILESNEIQLGNLVGPGHFDFHNHFISAFELFAPSLPLDLGATNPTLRYNLGLAQWVLGLGGLFAVTWIAIRRRHEGVEASTSFASAAFWGLCGTGLTLLILPLSQPVWEFLHPMAFIQFPWRLIGPAILCFSVAAGFVMPAISDLAPKWRNPIYSLLLVLPLMFCLPILVVPGWGDFGSTDREAIHAFELSGIALGTTSTGDYLPRDVQYVPPPSQELTAQFTRHGPIDRAIYSSLPTGVSVELQDARTLAYRYKTSSLSRFDLNLYIFRFAGWRASVDGQPAEVNVIGPEGFMTVSVPPGDHTVRVWFGPTLARLVGSGTSLLGLALLVVIAWRMSPGPSTSSLVDAREWTWGAATITGFIVLASVGTALGIFQPHSSGDIALPAQHTRLDYFQGGINLIGYDLPETSIRPGETLFLRLYWRAREPVPANYQVFVHITSVPEHTWGQSDKLNPGDYPTMRWATVRYVTDPHSITIPPGTPPGEYTIRVGLWNRETGVRQLVLEQNGAILGDAVDLPILVRVEPGPAPDISTLPVARVLSIDIAPGIRLVGFQQQPSDSLGGSSALLNTILYWQVLSPINEDYTIHVRAVDPQGGEYLQTSDQPADGIHPTTNWRQGEIVRDVHSLRFSEQTPPGVYRIEIGAASDRRRPARWFSLGEVTWNPAP